MSTPEKFAENGQYLLNRTDGEWFDIGPENYETTLVPKTMPWRRVDGRGDFRIEVNGSIISFAYEDPGILVCFESGVLTAEQEEQLLSEMMLSIQEITGQTGIIIPLN